MAYPSPQQMLGFLLGTTHRRISAGFAKALKPYDITPEQWSILLIVTGREGVNQKEIAAAAAKDQPTTARIIDQLQRKQFITKSVSPADRRAFLLYATGAGKALIADTLTLEAKNIEVAVAGLSAEQQNDMLQMLLQMNRNIELTHPEKEN